MVGDTASNNDVFGLERYDTEGDGRQQREEQPGRENK